MFKTIWPFMLLAVLTTSLSARADGELMVLPASLKLFNSHEQTVKVRNVGDGTLYLSVMLMKVENPGLMPEKKINLHEMATPGMLATPEKMTLGPNQSRAIRLTSLEEPAHESLYRLYITPVKSLKVEGAPEDKITAPMSFSVGYGVLVRHMPPPAKQQSAWTYQCAGGNITLVNTGNVRVRMSDVKVAPAKKGISVGLFPGTPQTFKGHEMTLNADDKPATVSCP